MWVWASRAARLTSFWFQRAIRPARRATFRPTSRSAEWKVIEPRKQDVEYYPDHNGDFFYIRVNDTGRNFRLVKAPVADPHRANWQEVVPHRADVMLGDADFFKNFYVSYERAGWLAADSRDRFAKRKIATDRIS